MTSAAAPATVCTIGIRLQGPMQSWAMIGRGANRGTHTRPTKSGVIGLIANALGRDFTDAIDDLAQLRFGVRVDAPGSIEIDYHTTGSGRYYALPREVAYAPSWWGDKNSDPTEPGWMTYAPPRDISESKAGTTTSAKANANITNDHYLADASFLAAVEGPDTDLLHSIAAALAAPARAVFLGRKAYGPASPLLEAVIHAPMETLFATGQPISEQATKDVYVEPRPGQPGQVIHDQPVTFNGPTRRAARLETHYTIAGHQDTPGIDTGTAPAGTLFDDVFAEGTIP